MYFPFPDPGIGLKPSPVLQLLHLLPFLQTISQFTQTMAIYSAVPPPPEQAASTGTTTTSHAPHHHHQLSNASTASVDIEAWTVSALEALSVSPVARGTGNPLSIPLDDHLQQRSAASADGNAAPRMKLRHVKLDVDTGATITPPRRPPSRRDSLRRRDALLKGNEGSRQRRRWENGME